MTNYSQLQLRHPEKGGEGGESQARLPSGSLFEQFPLPYTQHVSDGTKGWQDDEQEVARQHDAYRRDDGEGQSDFHTETSRVRYHFDIIKIGRWLGSPSPSTESIQNHPERPAPEAQQGGFPAPMNATEP